MGTHRAQQIHSTGLGLVALSVLAAIAAIAIVLTVGGHLRSVIHDSTLPNAPGSSVAGQR